MFILENQAVIRTKWKNTNFTNRPVTFLQITVTESDPGILPKSQANISEITVYGKGTN